MTLQADRYNADQHINNNELCLYAFHGEPVNGGIIFQDVLKSVCTKGIVPKIITKELLKEEKEIKEAQRRAEHQKWICLHICKAEVQPKRKKKCLHTAPSDYCKLFNPERRVRLV